MFGLHDGWAWGTGSALAAALVVWLICALRAAPSGHARAFTKDVSKLSWGEGTDLANLENVVSALSDLIDQEIRYYNRRRSSSRIAVFFRFLAWLCGTLGVLIPLSVPLGLKGMTAPIGLGYLLLVLAGALLAANRLLGWTTGHYRFAKAQLSLEALVSGLGLGWAQLRASLKGGALTPGDITRAFELLEGVRSEAHKIVLEERQEWGEQMSREEAAYAANLRAGPAKS